MLKKKQRLSRGEFTNLLKKGRRVHDTHLSLVFTTATETKCGLVVSKKVAKHATARNLLRRRVYAILGDNLAMLAKKHLVVLTKPSIQALSFEELKKTLETLIQKHLR
jgi:ribonuclease P protein component